MSRVRHILCPVDLSEYAEYALTYAAAMAERLDARLTALYAYQLAWAPYPDDATGNRERLDAGVRADRTHELRDMAARAAHGGLRVEAVVKEGRPHEVIVEEARSLGADLIVMGTHGRAGLPRMLLGSVAERVVRTSPVPVLTLHRPATGSDEAVARQ
jgi:nucleotide-binding universal stress UspA family protein